MLGWTLHPLGRGSRARTPRAGWPPPAAARARRQPTVRRGRITCVRDPPSPCRAWPIYGHGKARAPAAVLVGRVERLSLSVPVGVEVLAGVDPNRRELDRL